MRACHVELRRGRSERKEVSAPAGGPIKTIAAMTGWAGPLKAGQFVRITDPRGRQCADFWAFNANDLEEHLSAMHTRVWVNKLCPILGESFPPTIAVRSFS